MLFYPKKKKNIFLTIIVLLLISGFISAQEDINDLKFGNSPVSNSDTSKAAFVDWAKDNAFNIGTIEPGSGFDDLQSLRKAIGNARVVCLGETRHDIHEQFRLKHRIIEFLVKEMDFSVFAMEESLPYGDKINKYVLGGGSDPEVLLNNMGNWYVWDTKEVLALIKWMRKYNSNQSHEKKVEFYGIDITDPIPAIQNTLLYLEKVDTKLADILKNKLEKVQLLNTKVRSEAEIMERYKSLSDKEVANLDEFISRFYSDFKNNRSKYISRSSKSEFEWMLRQIHSIMVSHDQYNIRRTGTREEVFKDGAFQRDKGMADNVLWLLKQGGETRRIILWAHNFHIARNPLDMIGNTRMPSTKGFVPLGYHLREAIGDKLYSIGFSFYKSNYKGLQSAEEDMIDAAFKMVDRQMFFIDLKSSPKKGPVFEWLNQKHKMTGGGIGERIVAMLYPIKTYDAIIFINTITQTVMSPFSLERISKLR
ncbi:erythromycin esterase family protein [Acidobacteriota bacterium]